ncbi:MAG: DUF1963 domain-containing protein [Ruminococcus sp.]|nr:DUF1963 domain-containing protein [Ruminococcus sp.]
MDKKIILDIREKLKEKTLIPCMRMKLTAGNPSIFESKIGGIGYVPHGEQIPTNSKGYQLHLLAQIDCSKITLEDFPHTGLLQFWILNNDLAGADFYNNTNQDGFRIIYYKEIDKTVIEEEINEKIYNNSPDYEDLFPVIGCFGVELCEDSDSITEFDYRCENYIIELFNKYYPEQSEEEFLKDIDTLYDALYEDDDKDSKDNNDSSNSFGHKIGGYPEFTQWDPRNEKDSHDVLLFQLDSEYYDKENEIIWGDCGICNFFINQEKLKQCDFSDVIYNWDCY